MSRSFKKHPAFVVKGKWGRFNQKLAARRLRKMEDIPDGCAYKKHHPQWDIVDQREVYTSRSEAKRKLKGIIPAYRAWMK